jgi:hypothetical protein
MMIRLTPLYYTGDTGKAAAFFAALGFTDVVTRSRTGTWVELDARDALLCLHGLPSDDGMPRGSSGISFESDDDPDELAARLRDAGYLDAMVIDENFGRSLRVTGPDGTLVQVNFSDRSLIE